MKPNGAIHNKHDIDSAKQLSSHLRRLSSRLRQSLALSLSVSFSLDCALTMETDGLFVVCNEARYPNSSIQQFRRLFEGQFLPQD